MVEPDTDERLIERIAAGDKTAMRDLYERHHAALFGFIRSRCGDDFTAADVVHDAMLEVWRAAENHAGRASVKTWLFTVARNKMVDRFRKSSRLSIVDDLPEAIDEAPDPEQAMQSSQDAERVRLCMEKLSEPQRCAVRLAFFNDLPYEEIADIEKVPVGTIKTRIYHAKKALMACLGRRG